MQFRSINRRTVAALASTAVVAGALVVPTLLAAPAQAATVDDVAFTCTGTGAPSYTTDIALTAQWDKTTGRAKVSAELDNFPNGAPPQVSQPGQTQTSTLKVKLDGSATATSITGSTTANFQGGVAIDIPTLTGLGSAKAESLSVVIQDFTLVAGTFTFVCTPTTVPAAVVVPITFPTGSDLNYVCTFGANKFGYQTDATVSAVDFGSTLKVKVELEDMPNTAPVFISFPNATHASTLAMTVNGGSSVNAVGNSVANFTGGTPVVIPPVSVDVATTASSAQVTANNFTIVVDGSTTIPCALAAPVALPAVTATVNPAVATATALTATSPAGAQVSLSAKVTPTAAGNIEFYEGATKVGAAAANAGAATLALSAVSAGEHSYTAKFVPADADAFTGSTSTVVKVTVAAAGPSAACTTAQGDVTAAAAKVKAADAKVKKSQAKVKKAQAKVKKAAKVKTAKGKKQLKAAKKALKAAQGTLKADTKKASTAKTALTAANNAVKAAC